MKEEEYIKLNLKELKKMLTRCSNYSSWSESWMGIETYLNKRIKLKEKELSGVEE